MHVDVNRLKGKTVERGLTGEKIAKALGIDQSTYYRKMGDGGGGFTLSQAITMSEVLSLSREERIAIFFCGITRVNARNEVSKGGSMQVRRTIFPAGFSIAFKVYGFSC